MKLENEKHQNHKLGTLQDDIIEVRNNIEQIKNYINLLKEFDNIKCECSRYSPYINANNFVRLYCSSNNEMRDFIKLKYFKVLNFQNLSTLNNTDFNNEVLRILQCILEQSFEVDILIVIECLNWILNCSINDLDEKREQQLKKYINEKVNSTFKSAYNSHHSSQEDKQRSIHYHQQLLKVEELLHKILSI